MIHWTADDLRIVGDIVLGSLVASIIRLVALKAFVEPAAVFIGQAAYKQLDQISGDVLPNVFGPSSTLLKHANVDRSLHDQGQHSILEVDVMNPQASQCRV